jgi:hypothetical protein
MEQLLLLAKDNRSKESLKEIIHHITLNKHFVEFIIDQCQDRKAMNVLAPLTNNEELMGHICSLIDVQDVKRIKRDLEARQEEARSHNLDATQKSFKRPKGFARKLLSNYDPSDIDYLRELKRGNQDSTSVNLKLMTATFAFTAVCLTACFSVGLYFYHQGKKAAGEAKDKLHRTQMDKLNDKIDKLNEKNEKLNKKNAHYLELLEEYRNDLNQLRKQMIPPGAPNEESPPPRRESRLSAEREPSPPRKGSSRIISHDWAITPRRRSR